MGEVIYLKDRIEIADPVVPAVVEPKPRKKRITKLDRALEDLRNHGVTHFGKHHEVFPCPEGHYIMTIHKKTRKIHMEPTSPFRDDMWLACGPFLWGSQEDNYLWFTHDDPELLLTCDKCYNLLVFGRMHL
jgi:hypothetical protein